VPCLLTTASSKAPSLGRWIIDPAAGQVTEQRLDDRGQEFPGWMTQDLYDNHFDDSPVWQQALAARL
jgi:carotenoid cleavage dioxygenase-like enzyme